MQARVQQKHSGSSFVGDHSSDIAAYFDFIRLIVIHTQILHWRDFDAHVPACFRGKSIFGLTDHQSCPSYIIFPISETS
jgi:hypothetical protein